MVYFHALTNKLAQTLTVHFQNINKKMNIVFLRLILHLNNCYKQIMSYKVYQ